MNKQQLLHMQKLAGLITESEYNKLIAESSLKDKIRELVHSSLGEAKKKKDEEADVAPQEDAPEDTIEPTDMDMGMDVPSDADVDTGIDIDPKVKNIQNLLQKAYANAKSLGDEKLMTQIGNTITMVVRNQVLGGQAVAEESLNEEADEMEDNEDFDLDQAFEESPNEHSYNEVLDLFENYEDEEILDTFKSTFPEGELISKKDYYDFAMDFIDDMSEIASIKANWISLTDDDVYEKAGLI